MTILRAFHGDWALVVVALNFALAVWGLLAAWRGWAVPRLFFYLVVAALASVLPQVIAGVLLWSSGSRPAGGIQHIIYGIADIIFVLLGLFYWPRMRQRAGLLFGILGLLIFLASARGYLTGRGIM